VLIIGEGLKDEKFISENLTTRESVIASEF
jgi:hypothetical protein